MMFTLKLYHPQDIQYKGKNSCKYDRGENFEQNDQDKIHF